MNGNNIIVYTYSGSAWTPIAAVKSDELQHECDLIEKASATQQRAKEYISARSQWSLNVNWLMTTVSDLEKVLMVGTRVKIHVGARGGYSGASGGLTGFAYVKMCKVTNTRGNLSIGSFSFVGDGPLT